MSSKFRDIALESNEVHIWITFSEACHQANLSSTYASWLDPQEEERYNRFHFQEDRFNFLFAHALSRDCLARYCKLHPAEIRFSHNKYGRPELQHPKCSPSIHFSLTHAAGVAVLAVTHLRHIGIDIEDTRRQLDYLGIATTSFSTSEIQEINCLSGQTQKHRFFEHWTLKEAYTKALGMGLSFSFRQCIFQISPNSEKSILFTDTAERVNSLNWQFAVLQPLAYFCLALAVRSSNALKVTIMQVIPGSSSYSIKTKVLYENWKSTIS